MHINPTVLSPLTSPWLLPDATVDFSLIHTMKGILLSTQLHKPTSMLLFSSVKMIAPFLISYFLGGLSHLNVTDHQTDKDKDNPSKHIM